MQGAWPEWRGTVGRSLGLGRVREVSRTGSTMGLCKCPKRKVTNLFCFEHRVNVCEHCLVANHAKCIVQSYLQWLQDSDYNPNCRLCNIPLAARETTRLVCYDLFHWACLNERAAQLPRNTAPAGYQCPSCSGPIFPPTNLAGPVASALREKLATVNWARAGLGLPLIDEVVSPEPEPLNTSDFSDWSSFNASGSPKQEEIASASAAPTFYSQVPRPPASPSRPEQHTVIHVGNPEPLTHAFLSLWMPVALPLQPHPQGRCMTRGMMTGHQASMGIVMMTSTVAGLPWAGWPSCSVPEHSCCLSWFGLHSQPGSGQAQG
ncbi:zinc finger protein-like 1 isoform X3 [Mesoplodon densirostris]|uniref:zinc finger protein-like 1 isoform X3 n=1 Tax=Mesoplodon densirostris TaxID=48708 RepID=UPI0028DCB437|nr:zinc finger protein-like 1 isoform X3 [Mesoplodon densirostris]